MRCHSPSWYQYPPFLHTSQYSFVSTSLSVLMFRRYHVRTDLMILLGRNRTDPSFHLGSSDDNPVCFWFLEQNRHRNKFLQTASLDFLESLFQSKISVFQDFSAVREICADSAVSCNPQFFLLVREKNRFWYHKKPLHAKSIAWRVSFCLKQKKLHFDLSKCSF